MKLILDMGSGNSCQNERSIVRDMIDAVKEVDTGKHDIIFKWQLFIDEPPNLSLSRNVFDYAYDYAYGKYKTTASVFDKESLLFLRCYDTPFIKIACRPDLYPLIDEFDKFYVSIDNCVNRVHHSNINYMACISKYPAIMAEYQNEFPETMLIQATSDHTVGWDLYNKYKPDVLEKHFVLKHDKKNPDAGAFAVTADELKEIM